MPQSLLMLYDQLKPYFDAGIDQYYRTLLFGIAYHIHLNLHSFDTFKRGVALDLIRIHLQNSEVRAQNQQVALVIGFFFPARLLAHLSNGKRYWNRNLFRYTQKKKASDRFTTRSEPLPLSDRRSWENEISGCAAALSQRSLCFWSLNDCLVIESTCKCNDPVGLRRLGIIRNKPA